MGPILAGDMGLPDYKLKQNEKIGNFELEKFYNEKFYDDVFDECLKYGIEPIVTIAHFDIPVNLSKHFNGWASRELIDFYF